MLSVSNPNISLFSAGTLTQNEMVFKRLHLGTVSYGTDTMDEIQSHIIRSYAQVGFELGLEGQGLGLEG